MSKDNLPTKVEKETLDPSIKNKNDNFFLSIFSNKKEEKKQRKLERQNQKILYSDITTKEEKIIKKSSHKFVKALGIACATIIAILVISGLINIFTFVKGFFDDAMFGNIIAGSVTGVLVGLLFIFVIRPIIIAMATPTFSLDVVNEEDAKSISKKNFKKLQKVAKNILENDNVSEDNKNLIRTFYSNKKELNNTLKNIYDTDIKNDIMKIINLTSTKVLITTALSQNSKFDAISVALLNIRMIMQICVKCGYHPTYFRLSKLIIKVFRNAMFAYAVQSFNLQDILVDSVDKLVKGALSAIPGLSTLTKSLTQGASNALLTLRIGIITRKYLYEEFNIQRMIKNPDEVEVELVTSALKEADENIDNIVLEAKKDINIVKKGK